MYFSHLAMALVRDVSLGREPGGRVSPECTGGKLLPLPTSAPWFIVVIQ